MKFLLNILLIYFFIKLIESSLDISLQEWKYLADHLTDYDCKRLAAALHDPNFDIETNLEVAGNTISDDISCLNLLLHWNTSPNEGNVKSHTILTLRLNQLNHPELAEWLSHAIFQEVGREINETLLDNPFSALAITEKPKIFATQTNDLMPVYKEPDQWVPFDTIEVIIFWMLLSLLLFLIIKVLINLFKKVLGKRNKEKKLSHKSDGKEDKTHLLA